MEYFSYTSGIWMLYVHMWESHWAHCPNHARNHTHARTHTRTRTRTPHTHTHTHTHTLTLFPYLSNSLHLNEMHYLSSLLIRTSHWIRSTLGLYITFWCKTITTARWCMRSTCCNTIHSLIYSTSGNPDGPEFLCVFDRMDTAWVSLMHDTHVYSIQGTTVKQQSSCNTSQTASDQNHATYKPLLCDVFSLSPPFYVSIIFG